MINNDPMIMNERTGVNAPALPRRLPTMSFIPRMLRDGGLMSYAPDVPALFRHAATLVDRVLNGTLPSELPVEQPVAYRLTINLRTAEALGVDLSPSLLARADEVIE